MEPYFSPTAVNWTQNHLNQQGITVVADFYFDTSIPTSEVQFEKDGNWCTQVIQYSSESGHKQIGCVLNMAGRAIGEYDVYVTATRHLSSGEVQELAVFNVHLSIV